MFFRNILKLFNISHFASIDRVDLVVLNPRAMAACGGDNVPGAMHPEAFR